VGRARKRDHFESLELNGGMIIKLVLKKLASSVEFIDVVQNTDIWLTAANTIIKHIVP
jgi:hypothetical protein